MMHGTTSLKFYNRAIQPVAITVRKWKAPGLFSVVSNFVDKTFYMYSIGKPTHANF